MLFQKIVLECVKAKFIAFAPTVFNFISNFQTFEGAMIFLIAI